MITEMVFAFDLPTPAPPSAVEHIVLQEQLPAVEIKALSVDDLILLGVWEASHYHALGTAQEKSAFLQEFTEKILPELPDFSTSDALSSVADFAKSTLGAGDDLHINQLSTDNAHHRDLVYFISLGSKNRIDLIVKTYPVPSQAFFDEINGIKMHEKLELKYSSVASILNFGVTKMEGGTILMVAHSVAPGQTIQNYMTSVQEAAPALYRFGEALGELHSKDRSSVASIDEFMQELDQNYQTALKTMDDYLQKGEDEDVKAFYRSIDLRLLQAYVKEASTRLPEEVPTGHVHGDVHLKNFLYDDKNDTLSMIDLGGLAIGVPGTDYYHVMEHINALKLDDQERDSLREEFLRGYTAAGGNIPPVELLDLLRLNSQLIVLGTHVWIDFYTPDIKKIVKAIIRRNAEHLNSDIQNAMQAVCR